MIKKSDLTRLGRDQLLKLAEQHIDLCERTALSRVEQHKPAEEQTIPTCLFCDLIVDEGRQAVASPSGAVICEECIASASAALRRDQLRVADAVLHPDGKCRCAGEGHCAWCTRMACASFPGCGCTDLDRCRRNV